MTIWAALATVLISIVAMEIAAWAIHKYIMHSRFGWGWHQSHHQETEGPFEKNDLYAVCFSFIAAGLFISGSLWWIPLWFVALGLTIYGLLYAFVHDGLVHQRWPFFVRTRGGYMKRLVQAHRLHHAVHTRDGGVSFGFLWADDVRKLKAQLKAQGDAANGPKATAQR